MTTRRASSAPGAVFVDVPDLLAAEPAHLAPGADHESTMWLWMSFGLGLAQLGALADQRTFATTVDLLRRGVATLRTDGGSPSTGAVGT